MKHTLPKAHSMDKGCVIPFTLHLIKQLLPGHVKKWEQFTVTAFGV